MIFEQSSLPFQILHLSNPGTTIHSSNLEITVSHLHVLLSPSLGATLYNLD